MNPWFALHREQRHIVVPKQAYQQLDVKSILLYGHMKLDGNSHMVS
jgi:hypothetical protein